MYTPQQIQQAIASAQAAGDAEAVADLQSMLREVQAAPPVAPAGAMPPGATPPQQTPPQPSQPFQRAGAGALPLLGGGALQSGVGDAAIRGVLGVKQFFGGLSDQDKAVLAQMKQEEEAEPNKGTRGLGGILGNIAMLAVPGAKVEKAVRGLRVLQGAGRALPYLAGGAAAGATELATSVGQGDTFGEQMASKATQAGTAAATAPLFQKATQVLAKPLTGMFKTTPEAQRLFDKGINPTLHQAAAGTPGRFIGGLTAGAIDVRPRLRDEIGRAWLRQATDGNRDLAQGVGDEFYRFARGYTDDLWDTVWQGHKVNLSPTARQQVLDAVSKLPKDASGASQQQEAIRVLLNRIPAFDKNMRMNYRTFADRYRNPLSKDIFSQVDDEVAGRLRLGRDTLDDLVTTKGLPPEKMAARAHASTREFDVKRMEEALRGSDPAKEGINLERLTAAYARMRPQAAAVGNTTYDDLLEPATTMFSNVPTQHKARALRTAVVQAGLPATMTGALYGAAGAGAGVAGIPIGISLLGQTAGGSKYLFGQNEWQKKAAKLLRESAALRAAERGIVNYAVDGED